MKNRGDWRNDRRVPPPRQRARREHDEERHPRLRQIFAGDLRIGEEFSCCIRARYDHIDTETGEVRGYKYHLELEENEDVILYGTALLDRELEKYGPGVELHIVYQGKSAMLSGPNAGKLAHHWRVTPFSRRRR